MNKQDLTYYLALGLMGLIGVASVGYVLYAAIAGTTIPGPVDVLFGLVVSFLTTHISSAQGAAQALTVPADNSKVPAAAPPGTAAPPQGML